MTYTPGIPLANDYIDQSQPVLKDNFDALDSVFDVDHYKFSDATANLGKHKTVTTPAESSHVSTAANEPVLYAYQDIAALGVLQYSRGGSDAVPTPVTSLHGTIASLGPGATQSILDVNGLSVFYANLYAKGEIGTGSVYAALRRAGSLSVAALSTPGGVRFKNSGTEIQVENITLSTINNVEWTIQPVRIEV